MKHTKLKINKLKDKGFSKWDWVELMIMTFLCILCGAIVLSFFIAALKLITEGV